MNWHLWLYMAGLAASAGGFTAVVGYAMLWSAEGDGPNPSESDAVSVNVDGSPVDLAVVIAVDPGRRWVDVVESEPLADGKRKLMTRYDPASDGERAVRYRRVGRVRIDRPRAHA